jgi:hypothetical protein
MTAPTNPTNPPPPTNPPAPAAAPRPVDLGYHVYVTPGARTATTPKFLYACLARHQRRDFGLLTAHDRAYANEQADRGGRVLSAYQIDPLLPSTGTGGNTLWIITEGSGAQRRTTILLPVEFP